MISSLSLWRRLYDGVTMFALLNVMGLIGLFAFLTSTGALDGEKLRNIVAIMRGEGVMMPKDDEETATPKRLPEVAPSAVLTAVDSDMDVQIMRMEGERIKAELDQRLALNNSILLRVTTERERFKRERDLAQRRETKAQVKRQSEGFKKQIAIYEALAPKVALEHLLSIAEPDDAAAIFLEMETRKAKKIVEAAKRGDQMEKMKTILRRVREVEPQRFDDLRSGG